jgi:hypothetical protein
MFRYFYEKTVWTVIVNNSTNITNMNNHLSLQFIDHKKTTTYDIGSPSLYLGQLNNNNVSGVKQA